MPYIIDDVQMYETGGYRKRSILIEGNEFRCIDNALSKFLYMRMNGNSYILTPGNIFIDESLRHVRSFTQFKKVMKEKLLLKGCTTYISVVDVKFEREIEKKLNEQRNKLLNSPIDFLIAVRVPIKKLTPSFIRCCKRLKVPLVIVNIDCLHEIDQTPWGWIRDVLFPQQIAIFPQIDSEIPFKSFQKKWTNIMRSHKLLSIVSCPREHEPLSKDVLMKIGLYPERGSVRSGAKVNYNLYNYSDEIEIVEQNRLVDYDNHIPEVIVHNGAVLKAGEQIFFRPGAGKEISSLQPGRFQLQTTTSK
ncbi:hypothetical protein [Bacillus sp. FJAT-47783]|uniref:hypothetical protein n=1 Tax=Bacillus sp. FJAT-47783 TaxID=2922712 RepID=UPI001FAE260E|nr:hypothetical protein [Bacillus sp. FJAT-47783]